MPNFRTTIPVRRLGRAKCDHYSSYRDTLKEDFLSRCGYCNDLDRFRTRSYMIDHFVPQKPDGCTSTIDPADYYNLVYACSHCNLAKSNKWPTNNISVHNDGIAGFVEPTTEEYSNLFQRNDLGEIVCSDNNAIAQYIFIELKLDLPKHSIVWQLERLWILKTQIEASQAQVKDKLLEAELQSISSSMTNLFLDLFEIDNG
jgi:hypothetical protein